MSAIFDNFQKQKDFLLCVDSDGCAMDTMDIKHIRCFGPCMVEEWKLGQWSNPILSRWNEINLYTLTRGVNRFKGLAIALREISEKYTPIDGLQELEAWVEHSQELSNGALEKVISEGGGICLQKALHWSQSVNRAIAALPEEVKRPFPGVLDALAQAHISADIAVVSSANRQAIVEEWEKYGLAQHVDLILAQDAGTKAACIAALLKKGYPSHHVLMVGDAPGDRSAAEKNGVWFYPILVRQEAQSWKELTEKALPLLLSEDYGEYGKEKSAEFENHLRHSSGS